MVVVDKQYDIFRNAFAEKRHAIIYLFEGKKTIMEDFCLMSPLTDSCI